MMLCPSQHDCCPRCRNCTTTRGLTAGQGNGLSIIFRTSKFSNLSILIDTYHRNGAVYMGRLRAIICLMGDYWTIGLYCDKMVVYEKQLYEDTKVHNTSKLYMSIKILCVGSISLPQFLLSLPENQTSLVFPLIRGFLP